MGNLYHWKHSRHSHHPSKDKNPLGIPKMSSLSKPAWPSSKALVRLVSGRTSVLFRFVCPLSSEVVVYGLCEYACVRVIFVPYN